MTQCDPTSFPATLDTMSIILELAPVSDETSSALVNETGRAVVAMLESEGYELRPVYTGTRGGPFMVEVVNAITQVAKFVWTNRTPTEEALNDTSALVTIMGAAIALIIRVFRAHEAQVGKDEAAIRPIKISVVIDGVSIEVEAQDVDQANAALVVAQQIVSNHPDTAKQVSSRSKAKIQGRIPPKPRRRRK